MTIKLIRNGARFTKPLYLILCVCGLVLLGNGIYMKAKAQLAQSLINLSWQNQSMNNPPSKPWWWADIYAIATLEVPALKTKVYVMQDASGEALAFGPGHMPPSSLPGKPGHVLIAGHRDSHFAFLEDIKVGYEVKLQHYQGSSTRYRVVDLRVIDTTKEQITLQPERDWLTLITCYPFNNLATSGPLRLLVFAEIF